jgi:pimeloyl-ACP methyl ester carboxylesterase
VLQYGREAVGGTAAVREEIPMTTSSFDRRTITIHGHEVSYRIGGEGPVLLLVHGMAGSSSTWRSVWDDLTASATVIAPDLPGHGRTDKPRGDYSLGAQASFLRDLLVALGHDRATVVGTSLGGGIALQFSYQYPERLERLVLVGAGGLGEEVTPILRLIAVPGTDLVLPALFQPLFRDAARTVGGWFGRIGLKPAAATDEIFRAYASLVDPESRTAFIHTLRSVVDSRGQRVSAHDRLYLASDVPTLIVWGERDPIIPVSHGHAAHEAMPGSRLEIIPGVGHFPQVEDPRRFARVVLDFVGGTEPAHLEDVDLSSRLVGAP